MIKLYTSLGQISMTSDYFAGLVSTAAKSCYGVRGMATGGTADTVRSALLLEAYYPDRGVRVTEEGGRLCIELHIQVTYGLNIAAIVRSITNKVKYAVEDATALKVLRIDVYVDDIV
ncbi:MAG: Asp23/Gls24 family envelope stress response protein [Ruthenibacterium sp.]